jgi:N-acetylmuramoyl-L-alanine amidase
MKRVGLVIGHSHKEQGADNKTFGCTEYEWNSKFVPMVASALHALDIQPIIFYRDDLSTLPQEINDADVDLVLSFHCNAFNRIASGTEVLHFHKSKAGKRLAQFIQEAITDTLGLRDRGLKPVTEKDRGGYLLQKTAAPAVLLETFFIDNDTDFIVADGDKDLLATNIAEAVKEFVS